MPVQRPGEPLRDGLAACRRPEAVPRRPADRGAAGRARWRAPGGGAGASPCRRAWRRAWSSPSSGGFAGITWNWREAVTAAARGRAAERAVAGRERQTVQERDQKEAQRAKADAINRFLIDKLLLQAAPEHNTNARTLTLRAALDHAADEVATSFQGQPEIEAAIRLALGQTYHELGEFTRSEAHFRRSLELLRLAEGRPRARPDPVHDRTRPYPRHISTATTEAEAVAPPGYRSGPPGSWCITRNDPPGHPLPGIALRTTGRRREGEAMLRQSLDEARRGGRGDSPEANMAMSELAAILLQDGRHAEAEGLFRACVKYQLESIGPAPSRHLDDEEQPGIRAR